MDPSGKSWYWTPIQNGTYSAYLPTGNWAVYGVYNSSTQVFTNETATVSAQTPIVVGAGGGSTDNINFSNDLSGMLENGTSPVANAYIHSPMYQC